MFFTNFRENKVSLYKNEDLNDYLNKNTSIENITCFNQIATLFNLEKDFCSFYQSNFDDLVKHKRFLELDVAIIQNLMQNPFFPRWKLTREITSISTFRCLLNKNKESATKAITAWVNCDIEERKKYEKNLIEINSQFLEKKKRSFKIKCLFDLPDMH